MQRRPWAEVAVAHRRQRKLTAAEARSKSAAAALLVGRIQLSREVCHCATESLAIGAMHVGRQVNEPPLSFIRERAGTRKVRH